MTEEFVSINDAKIALKGSIRGTIISEKNTVSKDNWSRKDYVIADKSGYAKLTVWGEDITKFKVSYKYEIIKSQWKKYNGDVTISPSKYGSIKCIGVAEHQEQLRDTDAATVNIIGAPAAIGRGTITNAQDLLVVSELPILEASIKGIIHENTILIAQIEQEVGITLKGIYGDEPRGDKVGMYTRMNFYHLKGMIGRD